MVANTCNGGIRMEIPFTCTDHDTYFPQTWHGKIRLADPLSGEMEVSARDSYFHIICGRYRNGFYLCIPNINIGTDLAALSDTYWNQEHLLRCFPNIPRADIISIVSALAAVDNYIS